MAGCQKANLKLFLLVAATKKYSTKTMMPGRDQCKGINHGGTESTKFHGTCLCDPM